MQISNLKTYVFLGNFFVFSLSIWLIINSPTSIFQILAFLLALFSGEAILIAKNTQIKDRWWNIAIFPCVASTSLILAITVLTDSRLIQIFSLAIAWLISTFLQKAYLFFREPRKYKLGSLEYLATYGNIFVFFLLSLSFYGFRDYLETSFWLLFAVLVLMLAMIFYHFFWSNKLEFAIFWPYLALSIVIIGQIAWAISLLPFTYANSAVLLTVSFYTIVHLQKLHLQAKLTNEKIRHYLAFITLTFIIIFLSARWL